MLAVTQQIVYPVALLAPSVVGQATDRCFMPRENTSRIGVYSKKE